MPSRGRRITAAAATAALAVSLSACGGGGDQSIPPETSGDLIAQLDRMQGQIRAGNCEVAQGTAVTFKDSVENLPPEVDSETKSDLTKLADNLVALSDADQCAPTGASGLDGSVPSEATPTESTTSTTTTTTSSTTESTTSSSTTDQTTGQQPPGQGGTPPGQANPPAGQGNGGAGIGGGGSGGIGIKPKGTGG